MHQSPGSKPWSALHKLVPLLSGLMLLLLVAQAPYVAAVPTFDRLHRRQAVTSCPSTGKTTFLYQGKCYSSCPSGTYYSLKASTATKTCVVTPTCANADGFSTTYNKTTEACVCRPGRFAKDGKCGGVCSTSFKYSTSCTADGPSACLTGVQVVNDGKACGCSDSTKAVKRVVSTGVYTCATCTEAFGAGVKTCGSDTVTTCETNFVRASGGKSCQCPDTGFELLNGKCVAKCAGEQKRDSNGVCKLECGEGKYLATAGATTCSSCSDAFGDNIKTCDTTGILTCKDTFSKDIVSGATICRCAASQYTKTDSNGVSTCIACSTFDPKATKCSEAGATECLPDYKLLTDRTPVVCGCDVGSFDNGSACAKCTDKDKNALECNRNAITKCAASWRPSDDGKLCVRGLTCEGGQYDDGSSLECKGCKVGEATCDANGALTCQANFKYDKVNKACTCLQNSGRFINSKTEGPKTCSGKLGVYNNACGCDPADPTKSVKRLNGLLFCGTCFDAFGVGVATCSSDSVTTCAENWKRASTGKSCTCSGTTKDGKALTITGKDNEICSPACEDDQQRDPTTFLCGVQCASGKFNPGTGTKCSACDSKFTGSETCTVDGALTCKTGYILQDDKTCILCSDSKLPFGKATVTCNAEEGALTCNAEKGYVVVSPLLVRRRLGTRGPAPLSVCGCKAGEFDDGEQCTACTQSNVATCTKEGGIQTCKATYDLVTAEDGSKTCECSDSTWET
ncbi:hypothetical protein OIO90_006621, partial [Microbotryomycetes sp. JL221]